MTTAKKHYVVTIARRDPAAEAKETAEPFFWKKKKLFLYIKSIQEKYLISFLFFKFYLFFHVIALPNEKWI